MTPSFFLLLAAVFITTLSPLAAQTSFLTADAGIRTLKIDPARVATVADLTVQRDVGALRLKSGKLYLCAPIDGKVVAAVFVGDGSFAFRPPIDVERDHLRRFFQTDAIDDSFTSAVLFFTDITARELDTRATFKPGEVSSDASNALKDFVSSLVDSDNGEIDPSFIRALIGSRADSLFVAAVDCQRHGRLYFSIDQTEDEEVSLQRLARDHVVGDFTREIISQHHLQDEYMTPTMAVDTTVDFMIDRYRIASRIGTGLEFSAAYDVDITMVRDVAWTFFYLMPELVIDSMRWSSGERAEFYRAEDSYVVWLRNSPGLKRGATARLSMRAHGEPLGRSYNTVYLKSSSLWYPRNDFLRHTPAELVYETPQQFMFASAGRPDGEPIENNNGTFTSRWILEYPSRNISFNIGYFYEVKVTPDSLPTIVVLRDREASKSVGEQIAWDVENGIRFFTHLYGPLRSTYFSATQIPFSHGEAFPGLIHLSWITFEDNLRDRIRPGQEVTREGFNEFFRAHEVAHQWWGIGVDFATYHDQWLSEGFAEYSGLMYLQAVHKKNELFFDWLRYYKSRIVDNRNSIFGKGQEAGPIWLGNRTSTSTTEGDYHLIIYNKGAWVLHMLRVLMLDINTLSDEKWRAMMREFYGSHVGKHATTESFQRVAEKHAGASLEWFFKQWVFGTAIPTYAYSYTVTPTPEGKFLLKVRVIQTDVPTDFKSYPIVTIDFGDRSMSRARRPVVGPSTVIELLLPEEPDQIIFNDFESVLANVEEVDWK